MFFFCVYLNIIPHFSHCVILRLPKHYPPFFSVHSTKSSIFSVGFGGGIAGGGGGGGVAFPGFGGGCGAGGSAAAGVYLKTPAPYTMNGLGLGVGMGVDSLHPSMAYPPPSEYLYSEYKYLYRSEYWSRQLVYVCL